MDKGIIWKAEGRFISHAISWHEANVPNIGNIRIWIHSRGSKNIDDQLRISSKNPTSRTIFTVTSLDIQVQEKSFKPITNEEKLSRIALAELATSDGMPALKASFFRDLPYAKFENDHIKCLSICRKTVSNYPNSRLKIVDTETIPTLIFKNGNIISKFEDVLENKIDIATNQRDAVVIAKIYSEISKLGTTRIVKQICTDYDIASSIVYGALRTARIQGWLTTEGKGKPGGRLTAKGSRAYMDLNGDQTLELWIKNNMGESK